MRLSYPDNLVDEKALRSKNLEELAGSIPVDFLLRIMMISRDACDHEERNKSRKRDDAHGDFRESMCFFFCSKMMYF